MYLKSNVNMSIESQYMTSDLMSKVMFSLYNIMSEIPSTYCNRKLIYNFLFDGSNIFALWVPVCEILTFKIVWPWPVEWVKGNCNYAYRKPIYNFIFDANSKICLIFHLYEIIIYELFKCTRFKYLIFKEYVNVIRYNVADYVIEW